MIKQIIVIIGAIMVIEGLPYMAAPGAMKRMMEQVKLIPDTWLRVAGAIAVISGLMFVWFAGNMD